jgi:hypothetical protein
MGPGVRRDDQGEFSVADLAAVRLYSTILQGCPAAKNFGAAVLGISMRMH